MKTLLLLTTFVLGLSSPMLAQTSAKAEAEVRAANEAFLRAAKEGDGAALNKLFADGLQYSHSSAKLENKQETIAALVKTKGNFEVLSQTIRVYGKVATIRSKVTSHGATGDIPLTMLMVWVKNGGNWQLAERHTTRIPAP